MVILQFRKLACLGLAIAGMATASVAIAQTEQHGRKWVPPPPSAHIEVLVTKANNGKPVANAAVIFHPIKNGKDEGNMEIKTDRDGVAILDLIPVGDTIRLQVVAEGFQTFGQDYLIDADNKQFAVKLQRPAPQSSLYAQPSAQPTPDPAAQPAAPTPPATAK